MCVKMGVELRLGLFNRDNDDSPLALGTHYVQRNPYNYQP